MAGLTRLSMDYTHNVVKYQQILHKNPRFREKTLHEARQSTLNVNLQAMLLGTAVGTGGGAVQRVIGLQMLSGS